MDVHPTCFVRKHRGVLSKTLPWCGDERRCGAVAHPFPMSSSKHRQNSFSNHRGSGRMESVRERQQGLDIRHLHGVRGFWLSIRNHEKQTTTLGMERHYNHTFYHLSLIHLLWCSSCFGRLTLPHGHQIWDDPSTGANIWYYITYSWDGSFTAASKGSLYFVLTRWSLPQRTWCLRTEVAKGCARFTAVWLPDGIYKYILTREAAKGEDTGTILPDIILMEDFDLRFCSIIMLKSRV